MWVSQNSCVFFVHFTQTSKRELLMAKKIYAYVCVYVYVCVCIHIRMYIRMYVCMYV